MTETFSEVSKNSFFVRSGKFKFTFSRGIRGAVGEGAGGGAEGGTADSSPQSGNTGHLDIEDEVESSEEEEETDRDLGKQNYLRMEPKSSPPQVRVFYI